MDSDSNLADGLSKDGCCLGPIASEFEHSFSLAFCSVSLVRNFATSHNHSLSVGPWQPIFETLLTSPCSVCGWLQPRWRKPLGLCSRFRIHEFQGHSQLSWSIVLWCAVAECGNLRVLVISDLVADTSVPLTAASILCNSLQDPTVMVEVESILANSDSIETPPTHWKTFVQTCHLASCILRRALLRSQCCPCVPKSTWSSRAVSRATRVLASFWRVEKLRIHLCTKYESLNMGAFQLCFFSIDAVNLETCSLNDTSALLTILMPALGSEECPVWPTRWRNCMHLDTLHNDTVNVPMNLNVGPQGR